MVQGKKSGEPVMGFPRITDPHGERRSAVVGSKRRASAPQKAEKGNASSENNFSVYGAASLQTSQGAHVFFGKYEKFFPFVDNGFDCGWPQKWLCNSFPYRMMPVTLFLSCS